MKSLYESLFDVEDNIENVDRVLIEKFIKENYVVKKIHISDAKNKDGKYEVHGDDVIVKNRKLTSLTDGTFIWKSASIFSCVCCKKLQSLEGAPEDVVDFNCESCETLTTLKYAPKIVRNEFNCGYCSNLTSLEGAPEVINGNFICRACNLVDLKGSPKKIGGYFDCGGNVYLTSLEGAPKKVGDWFDCHMCGEDFTKNDVLAVCKCNKWKIYI